MNWKKLLLVLLVVVLTLFVFLLWYKARYSMETARSFEISPQGAHSSLLIATQGSRYKEAVVAGIVSKLNNRPVHIKVIDVSGLPDIDENDWDAIVVMHNWENWKPQADAREFIQGVKDKEKLIVLSTSGAGDMKIEGVDAITSASDMTAVPDHVEKVMIRMDAHLR